MPPLILSYLSFRARDLGEEVVGGILKAGGRAILIDGANYDLPDEMNRDPRVERLGRVPIEGLWGRAAVIIHGGGAGIAHEALAAGVPQIAIPRNTEQETTARKLEEFGAGRLVPVSDRPLEPFELSSGFRTLAHTSIDHLGPRVTSALEELLRGDTTTEISMDKGDQIRSLPSIDEAMVEIENLMASRA